MPKGQLDDALAGGGIASKLSEIGAWMGVAEDSRAFGTEEETQGLLGYAEKGLRNVAERAGGSLGGNMGTAMQVAAISKQRWMAFGACLVVGCLLMAISFASLPLILLAPHKFAFVFTSGSLCFMGSFAALKGTPALLAHLTSPDRMALSAGYVGSMAGTLWASLWARSTLLTIVFSCVQISSLLWFFASYIPGGSTVLGVVCDFLKGGLRRACCGCFSKGGSLPL